MKHLIIIAAFISMAQTASAQKAVHIVGLIGFNAESEFDEVKIEGRSVSDGEKEDIEDNFGVQITFDAPVSDRLRMGVRLAGMTAAGEDTEATYQTADAGLWLRMTFPTKGVIPFVAGGAGVTWATLETDDSGEEKMELDGLGWHIAGGVGIEVPAEGVSFTAGLYFTRQQVEPEGNVEGQKIVLEEGVLTRAMLAAGLAF